MTQHRWQRLRDAIAIERIHPGFDRDPATTRPSCRPRGCIGAQVLAALFAERRASEASLAHANIMLKRERDNKLLNAQAVTAAIAHEIRQPLASIVTNSDTALRYLEREPPNIDRAAAALTNIKGDGKLTSDVFEGIRALFVGSGIERQPIDLNRIVLSVTDSLKEELRRHGVVTRHELTTELPPVIGHGVQLREVVFNLINNAIEAMDPRVANRNGGQWSR